MERQAEELCVWRNLRTDIVLLRLQIRLCDYEDGFSDGEFRLFDF